MHAAAGGALFIVRCSCWVVRANSDVRGMHGTVREGDAPRSEAEKQPENELLEERAIVCAACGALLTSSRHRENAFGSHEHTFMNPAGFVFTIGCFSKADGCIATGPSSDDWSWFPGYRW